MKRGWYGSTTDMSQLESVKDSHFDPPSVEQPMAATDLPVPSGVWGWLNDRLGLSSLAYAVPAHANTFWYTLGGITFFGIAVLAVTGIWLAQYYNADPLSARESVLYIQNEAPFGDLVRGIHVWMAYLVVISAALHLIRVLVTASYKVPREANWLVGLALLASLFFGGVFSGTILRWDQEAYEAMVHNMEATTILGALSGFFSDNFTSSVAMLPRLYATHVSIVPLLLALLLIVHFFLIKHHGISPTPAQADAGQAPGGRLPKAQLHAKYSTHLRVMVGYGLALIALAAVLGVVWPQAIGPAPDPTMEVTKPPFVFFWLYPFENWFGVRGIVYGAAAFFGLLAVLPFLDRGPLRSLRGRPLTAVFGTILVVAVVALSILTAVQPTAQHLGR
jgi:quinol-cytochrome oxidoreductase complex cytochrome b subunit